MLSLKSGAADPCAQQSSREATKERGNGWWRHGKRQSVLGQIVVQPLFHYF